MTVITRRFLVFLSTVLVLLAAAACQAAPKAGLPTVTSIALPTSAPAIVSTPEVEGDSPTAGGYPAPEQVMVPSVTPVGQQAGPSAAYPATEGGESGGPAAGAPAVENRSKIQAKLVEAAPDPDNSGLTRLHVLVLSSENVENMPGFTTNLVNTEIDLYAETANLPELKPGDSLEATVTYRGDEQGGKYFVVEMKKLE
jgi:hypothetical protein